MSAWKVVWGSSKHSALQGKAKAFASISDMFMGSVGSQNTVVRVQVMAFPSLLLWGNSTINYCNSFLLHWQRPFFSQNSRVWPGLCPQVIPMFAAGHWDALCISRCKTSFLWTSWRWHLLQMHWWLQETWRDQALGAGESLSVHILATFSYSYSSPGSLPVKDN